MVGGGENLGRGKNFQLDFGGSTPDRDEMFYLERFIEMKKTPSRLNTSTLVLGKTRKLKNLFPERQEEIRSKRKGMSVLVHEFPGWARPRLAPLGDDNFSGDKDYLRQMPYW